MEKKYTSLSGIFLLVIWITFLTGCPGGSGPTIPDDDVIDDPNLAPVVEFATWDYEVRGANTVAEVNQNYIEDGTSNFVPMYVAEGTSGYKLFLSWISSPGYFWAIDTEQNAMPSSVSEFTYYAIDGSPKPPETGWLLAADDSSSALSVIKVPIRGDTSTYGNTLTAKYNFTDPDGDDEGESTYQWYRCDNPEDEGTIIPGATGLSYTTTSADNLKYLKIEVIPIDDPVDEHGLEGDSVKSSASDKIGST